MRYSCEMSLFHNGRQHVMIKSQQRKTVWSHKEDDNVNERMRQGINNSKEQHNSFMLVQCSALCSLISHFLSINERLCRFSRALAPPPPTYLQLKHQPVNNKPL